MGFPNDSIGPVSRIPGWMGGKLPSDVFMDWDDFTKTPVDDEDYAFSTATANPVTGTMALNAGGRNGVLALDSASTNATYGAQIQRPAAQFIPVANKDIWFATALYIDEQECEFFAGLANIDTSIMASSAISTTSHVGFNSATDDGVILTVSEKAGVTATGVTAHTFADSTGAFAADSLVEFGFHIKGTSAVDYYVNGNLIYALESTTIIPNVALSPSFVCQSGGTQDPIMYIDYWICAQTR